jgi:penicillin-binding protein 1A
VGHDTPKKLGSRETGGGLALPIWIEFMQHALQGVPVQEFEPPAGVVQQGGYWKFEEFTGSAGIVSVGLGEALPKAPSAQERSSILDLFKR